MMAHNASTLHVNSSSQYNLAERKSSVVLPCGPVAKVGVHQVTASHVGDSKVNIVLPSAHLEE